MDIDIVLKVAGIGMIVAVICQILSRAGRYDHSTLVSLTGIVIIFILIAKEIGVLISELRSVFGI